MRACVPGFRSLHLRKLQDGAGAVAAYPTGEHNFELNYENRTTDQWLNNSAQYTPKSYKSQDMIVSWPQTVTRGWMSAMISFFWRALGNGKKIFPRFGENNLGRYRPQSATRIGVNGWPVTLVGWTVLVRRGPPGRSGAQLQISNSPLPFVGPSHDVANARWTRVIAAAMSKKCYSATRHLRLSEENKSVSLNQIRNTDAIPLITKGLYWSYLRIPIELERSPNISTLQLWNLVRVDKSSRHEMGSLNIRRRKHQHQWPYGAAKHISCLI